MGLHKPNVLLTTVCRPFGGVGEGDSVAADLFHAQVTRSQGILSYRQVIRCWGLDYIAENIDAPSVFLHYPSEREFFPTAAAFENRKQNGPKTLNESLVSLRHLRMGTSLILI